MTLGSLVHDLGATWSRITNANPQKRPPLQDASVFLTLPPELLDAIFTYNRDIRTLGTLRLVCSRFDEVLRHLVGGYLTLPPITDKDTWEMLRSPRGKFFKETHTLKIGELVAYRNPGIRERFDEAMLINDVCRCLRKLKCVKTLRWTIQPRLGANNQTIFDTIARSMHLLENVTLELEFRGVDIRYLLSLSLPPNFQTSNIKSISLSLYPWGQPDQIFPVTRLKHRVIEACPHLEKLSIVGPRSTDGETDFLGILGDLPTRSAFKPTLTSLKLERVELTPILPVLHYLSNLTSLAIPNRHESDYQLWPALQASQIRLQIIEVSRVTRPLNSYLESYTGLREFHGVIAPGRGAPVSHEELREAMDCLLSRVLPKHKSTLEVYRCRNAVRAWQPNDIDVLEAEGWAFTISQNTAIKRWGQNLRTLEVALLHHENGHHVHMDLVTTLEFLYDHYDGPAHRRLEKIYISPFGPAGFDNSPGMKDPFQALGGFILLEDQPSLKPLPDLILCGHRCTLLYDQGLKFYRFPREDWYGKTLASARRERVVEL